MRAMVYARVSSDPRGRGRSVDEQVAECTAWAEREGWTVVDTLTDNDRSASRHAKQSRPAWEKVKSAISAGAVDILVTWEASRAQRDLEAYGELRKLCAAHGVRWAYSGAIYDMSDRSDRFRTGLDALVSEDEADRTRERVLRAVRANANAGRPHGRRLFGYRRVYDDRTGELVGQVPDDIEAAIVREAAARILAGESGRAIADDLNARDVAPPAKGGWDATKIKRVCTNPSYNGKRSHQGQVIGPAAWDAILDDDTFGKLAAVFDDPSRHRMRRGPRVNLLSGVARCGVCGGPMRYARQGGFVDGKGVNRKVREQYTCHGGKFCVARDLVMLEEYVTTVVVERLSRPDVRDALTDEPDPDVDDALAEVAELRERLAEAVAEFTAGRLTGATLAKIESDLLPRIGAAERRARVAGLPTAAADIAGEDDPVAAWEALGRDQQREVIRALLTPVVLPVAKRGTRGFDPSTVRIDWHR